MPARLRGHNEGSIYQLPEGTYRAALAVHLPDGTTKRKTFRGQTKQIVVQ